jgi:hypothetical protein
MFRIVFSILVGTTAGALVGGTVCVIVGLLWLDTLGMNCPDESCVLAGLADIVPDGLLAGGAAGAAGLAGLTERNRRRSARRYG